MFILNKSNNKKIFGPYVGPPNLQLKLWPLAPSSVCIFPTTYYPIYRMTICIKVHWPYNVNDTDQDKQSIWIPCTILQLNDKTVSLLFRISRSFYHQFVTNVLYLLRNATLPLIHLTFVPALFRYPYQNIDNKCTRYNFINLIGFSNHCHASPCMLSLSKWSNVLRLSTIFKLKVIVEFGGCNTPLWPLDGSTSPSIFGTSALLCSVL